MAGLYFYQNENIKNLAANNKSENIDKRLAALEQKYESNVGKENNIVQNQFDDLIKTLPTELPETESPQALQDPRVDLFEQRIKKLEDELVKVHEIENKIKQTNEVVEKNKNGIFGPLIMAIIQVQDQIRKGQPYDTELKLAELKSGEDATIIQHIKTLKAHSETGVVSKEVLRENFTEIAGQIVIAERKRSENNFWDRTRNKFSEMFLIRRIDRTKDNSPESIVAKIENLLKNNNIAEAVIALEDLGSASQDITKDWLAAASDVLAVEYAIEGILNRVSQISAEQ